MAALRPVLALFRAAWRRPPPTRDDSFGTDLSDVAKLIQPLANLGGTLNDNQEIISIPRLASHRKWRPPMTIKYLRLAIVLLAGLQLAGCYTDYGPVEVAVAPVTVSQAGTASILQPGDKVKITVYGEEALTGEYDVNPTGSVAMPLIGLVKAAGKTQTQFARDVASRYRGGGYLQDPKVTVAIDQFKPFYVLGEALRPGEYPFRSGLDVHSAVAMAGGFTYRASKSVVLIRHGGEAIWKEYPLTEAVPIAPGDLIRVPERYF
jgi:hypothetical protein